METGMIVTTTILIVICTVPFILIIGSTKKKEKQIKNALKAGVAKNNGTLTDCSININFALGLDSKAKQIYYYKKTPEVEFLQKINLNTVKTCEITKDTKRIRNGKSNYEKICRVALLFTSKKGQVIEQFELFNYDDSSQLSGELALADTWKKKVIDLLATNLEEHKIQEAPLEFA
ncbi:MAG: hypothetical protein ACI840_002202 [Ulvibacter sp.]|jgi:hypothetical protein